MACRYAEGYSKEDTFEGDSAMKSVNAAMLGVAVGKGLIDVDEPLAQYGVEPHGLWAPGQQGNKHAPPNPARMPAFPAHRTCPVPFPPWGFASTVRVL